MVLHLKEFEDKNPNYSRYLSYYDKLPGYLHEMTVEEIMEHINRNGERSRYIQGRVILTYFIWIHQTYSVNMTSKNFELQHAIGKNKSYLGFFSLDELKQAIKYGLLKTGDENNTKLPDYSGLIAIFYLEWYGVLLESAITIKLTDVSDDGKEVFVPDENRTITIDDEVVADYFAEYKQKTGFQRYKNSDELTPYVQSTFYRNTARNGSAITIKTIYNIRQKFIALCEDERFAKKRVYWSGRYAEMFKTEMKMNREFSASNSESVEAIDKIFNSDMAHNQIANLLREYAVFKKDYIERL